MQEYLQLQHEIIVSLKSTRKEGELAHCVMKGFPGSNMAHCFQGCNLHYLPGRQVEMATDLLLDRDLERQVEVSAIQSISS